MHVYLEHEERITRIKKWTRGGGMFDIYFPFSSNYRLHEMYLYLKQIQNYTNILVAHLLVVHCDSIVVHSDFLNSLTLDQKPKFWVLYVSYVLTFTF